MAEALRTAMAPLPKADKPTVWKSKLPKGVIAQDDYHAQRGRKASWKTKG